MPLLVVVMGVCGAGKSTFAHALSSSEENNCCYLEADDYHSEENKDKMARGSTVASSNYKYRSTVM